VSVREREKKRGTRYSPDTCCSSINPHLSIPGKNFISKGKNSPVLHHRRHDNAASTATQLLMFKKERMPNNAEYLMQKKRRRLLKRREAFKFQQAKHYHIIIKKISRTHFLRHMQHDKTVGRHCRQDLLMNTRFECVQILINV
jgi:hypothetical protein